jgi:hypothetical protein
MANRYLRRWDFHEVEVSALHAEGFGRSSVDGGWWERVNRHSLG